MKRRLFVLSGGGGAGVVKHTAMLAALYARGLYPSALAGTSAGGICALAMATGMQPETLAGHLRALSTDSLKDRAWGWLARFRFLESIYRGHAARRMIQRVIPHGRENLRLPCHVFGVDEDSGDLMDLCLPEFCDNLQDAAMATMSAPPFLPAVRLNGRRVVDGGVAFNLPLIWGWEEYDETYLLIACDHLQPYPRRDILTRTVRAVQLLMAAQVEEVLDNPVVRAHAQQGRVIVLWPELDSPGGLLDVDVSLLKPTYTWAVNQLTHQPGRPVLDLELAE